MATINEHKALIEEAVLNAALDGFNLSIENKCGGCCCDYIVELYTPYSTTEIVELELET